MLENSALQGPLMAGAAQNMAAVNRKRREKYVGKTRAADYAADQPESFQVIKTQQPVRLHNVCTANVVIIIRFSYKLIFSIFTCCILVLINEQI